MIIILQISIVKRMHTKTCSAVQVPMEHEDGRATAGMLERVKSNHETAWCTGELKEES